jgi:Fic family protein
MVEGSSALSRIVEWQGIAVEAAAPRQIAEWDPPVSVRTVRLAEQAVAAVQRFGDLTSGATEVAARLLVRADGIASSAIEGLSAQAADVALAEANEESGDGVAHSVADNLGVITVALHTKEPMTTRTLLSWHSRLMRHAPNADARHVGQWRDVLGWVGEPNPRVAAHVAALPEDIPEMMNDLVAFTNRDDLDAVTQAAIAHAQFETIHPFADGNGRIGRVLIGWILRTRTGVNYTPPLSVQLAKERGAYLSGLALYREDHVDQWVSWFAEAVAAAAHSSTDVLRLVKQVEDQWRDATEDLRSDSAARRIIELLAAQPVLSTRLVADLLKTSRQAALNGLVLLEGRGILTPVSGPTAKRGRREHWWKAGVMFELLGD